jgi:hypothetical protein
LRYFLFNLPSLCEVCQGGSLIFIPAFPLKNLQRRVYEVSTLSSEISYKNRDKEDARYQ